jgi:hypothetical protein
VATSGILWHLAFGQVGIDIYLPVEFSGASNLDGKLEAVGLIQGAKNPDVRAIWVLSSGDAGWLVRGIDAAPLMLLLGALPGPVNKESNELWCRQQLTPTELAELKAMIEVKAFELWDLRVQAGRTGTSLKDWLGAETALGIPRCAPA